MSSTKKRNANAALDGAAEGGDEKKQRTAAAGKEAASVTALIAPAAIAAAAAPNSSALNPQAYSASASEHSARFQSYATETKERAHRILHTVLPRKVLELDAIVQSHPPFVHNITPPYDESGSFIAGRESAPIEANPSLAVLIPLVKKEVLELIDNLGTLKLMVQLRIPAVDDANNFGVEVQEESINEIAKVEDVAFQWLDKAHNYYGNRTRVVAKISKYPAILDYWQSVRELDESFYTDLRLQTVEMRNSYTTLHDLLKKNEEKINNPRGEAGNGTNNRRHAFA